MIIARIALTILCLASALTLVASIPYTISLAVVCLVFIAAMASM
jgi:hypothetical protein